jgi:hypothetical protein
MLSKKDSREGIRRLKAGLHHQYPKSCVPCRRWRTARSVGNLEALAQPPAASHSRRVPPGTWRASFWPLASAVPREYLRRQHKEPIMDDKTRIELEAAVYRRLVEHLRSRTDVQNIDMMNLAGFCRNCLSNWMKDAADAKSLPMTKDESREIVYGEPFDQWKAKHQKEASKDQKAAFEKSAHKH